MLLLLYRFFMLVVLESSLWHTFAKYFLIWAVVLWEKYVKVKMKNKKTGSYLVKIKENIDPHKMYCPNELWLNKTFCSKIIFVHKLFFLKLRYNNLDCPIKKLVWYSLCMGNLIHVDNIACFLEHQSIRKVFVMMLATL